ncbi:hypothetical protein [Algibacter sp. 2305UL17-15]|uniref:hypothetical protein n=1 Tax=Algibacter sp. 2305UL17-15 TaxID=3231268 RepID=UPI0034587371
MKTTLLILSLLLLQCCSEKDNGFTPTLPPITQTGANTFGCYIDGKLLTPRDGTGTFNLPDSGMSYTGLGIAPNYDYNEIKVHDFKSGTGGLMDIHIHNLHAIGEGSYVINESNCEDNVDANQNVNIRCRWWDENLQVYKWYCSMENSGTLNINRYDFKNRIVSGTFECTAQNRDDPNEIIEITQGRFDIKWDAIPSFP